MPNIYFSQIIRMVIQCIIKLYRKWAIAIHMVYAHIITIVKTQDMKRRNDSITLLYTDWLNNYYSQQYTCKFNNGGDVSLFWNNCVQNNGCGSAWLRRKKHNPIRDWNIVLIDSFWFFVPVYWILIPLIYKVAKYRLLTCFFLSWRMLYFF